MNNQREIYEALLAGEALASPYFTVKINENGDLVHNEKNQSINLSFDAPQDWQIYKEPKWYENIPEGGVLCMCSGVISSFPGIINRYEKENASPYVADSGHYKEVTPLTKQEIEIYLKNAPEEL